MMFMNEYEIQMYAERYRSHAVLGPATRFLQAHSEEVNNHSDGWPYFSAAVRPAKRLIQMIQKPETATPDEYRKALIPIRSFYTRKGNAAGMRFPQCVDS